MNNFAGEVLIKKPEKGILIVKTIILCQFSNFVVTQFFVVYYNADILIDKHITVTAVTVQYVYVLNTGTVRFSQTPVFFRSYTNRQVQHATAAIPVFFVLADGVLFGTIQNRLLKPFFKSYYHFYSN
jgi:hypothetical protein